MKVRLNEMDVISIHSLHTEGDIFPPANGRYLDISIHSLHTEGDSGGVCGDV